MFDDSMIQSYLLVYNVRYCTMMISNALTDLLLTLELDAVAQLQCKADIGKEIHTNESNLVLSQQ